METVEEHEGGTSAEGNKEGKKEGSFTGGKTGEHTVLTHFVCYAVLHAGSCGVTVGSLNLLLLQVWFVCR